MQHFLKVALNQMTQLCNKLLFMRAQDKTNDLSGAQGL